ncbi:MAG: hypothetical protein AUJ07_05655 [Crenarchaeota archaeon 13_1_40CM_3_53_5]|nr:MAG: hypothetical protein AUJ07_05655 [Crenarchaeota archaeon 13_1_40CM_3_53_5]
MQPVTNNVNPIPKGYGTVTPYLVVDGVPKLIDFLKRVFDAEERGRMINEKNGLVRHVEVRLGGSMVMISDSNLGYNPVSSHLYVYVENVDQVYKRALEAGAVSQLEPTTQFFGDRLAAVKDPTGNVWYIATRVEDVSSEEMKERMKKQGLTGDFSQ